MPSLTTSNCNMTISSQKDNLSLKKATIISSNQQYTKNNCNPTSLSSSCENLKSLQQHNINNHYHVRRLSSLDCYTLKNEIVKLNPKSSYCFDNNTYDYSKSTNWKENCKYEIGDLVCYNRQYYKVIQNVLSEKNQTPDISNEYYILIISKISKVVSKRVLISKWTPYCRFITKGEQVYYDGKVWTALVSQNYEENKKRNPLFMADSPNQPSQKGLWETEDYNIDELEIVEDMIEFSDDDNTSIISNEESEVEADIDSSTINDEGEDYMSDISKDLNDMEVASSSSALNTPNLSEKIYIRHHESDCSTNSDHTMNEDEDLQFVRIKKESSNKNKLQNILKSSEIQFR